MNITPLYDAFKTISCTLRNNDIISLGDNITSKNSSMDIQKKIDILANDAIKMAARNIPDIIGVVSEEDDNFIVFKPTQKKGYVLIFDPMDGSNNVYSNITVGTIYGIYEYDLENDKFLSIYETGYCVYGPSTILIKTVKNEQVQQYHLTSDNKFILTKELKLITNNLVFCINMSYKFDNDVKTLINTITKDKCTQRWCGAMVADIHQVLMRGGTFIYPRTDKNPNGKIRLLYEALPIANIFNVLGGCAIDMNNNDILSKINHIHLQNDTIHGEIPIILSTFYKKQDLTGILEINDIIKC